MPIDLGRQDHRRKAVLAEDNAIFVATNNV
jgi:hypothetical protein